MILHIINHPAKLDLCLSSCSDEDLVLLTEHGVVAITDERRNGQVEAISNLYVLTPDTAARGLTPEHGNLAGAIDYAEFVSLTVQADKVVSW